MDEDVKPQMGVDSAAGAGALVDPTGEDKELLGKMRISVDPFAPPEKRQRHFLTLSASLADGARIPREYDMQMTPDEQPIHVFSDVRDNTPAAEAARRRQGLPVILFQLGT